MQKRLYRKGWNVEWNKKLNADPHADAKERRVDSLEISEDISTGKETFCTENKESIPLNNSIPTIVEQPPVHLDNTLSISSIIIKQNETIASFKTKFTKSFEKKEKDGNMQRSYLIPLIGLVVGILILLMSLFLVIPMNQILGILLLFLGMLLVVFALIKIILLLFSNISKAR